MRRLWLIPFALLLAAPVAAQLKIDTGADGRLVLTNAGGAALGAYSRNLIVPRADLIEMIEKHAVERSLDPLLVRAVIQVESAYNPRAVSHKGAQGLMQLMPQTAAELSVRDPFDPDANIRGGTTYLRRMLDLFDDRVPLALAGYNAGPEAVRRYGGVPPYQETRQYIRRVMTLYQGADFKDIPEYQDVGLDGRRTYLVQRDGRLLMTTTRPNQH